MEKLATSSLMQRLSRTTRLDHFLKKYECEMQPLHFDEYIRGLCLARGEVQERVILRAGVDRTYGHQLFNGRRRPSRDKALQLAFGFGLDVEETQKLLRAAGKSELYPRLKRDAVLIWCLQEHKTVMETQELLSGYGLTLLGGGRTDED